MIHTAEQERNCYILKKKYYLSKMLKKYLSLCMISNINEERKKTPYIGFLRIARVK